MLTDDTPQDTGASPAPPPAASPAPPPAASPPPPPAASPAVPRTRWPQADANAERAAALFFRQYFDKTRRILEIQGLLPEDAEDGASVVIENILRMMLGNPKWKRKPDGEIDRYVRTAANNYLTAVGKLKMHNAEKIDIDDEAHEGLFARPDHEPWLYEDMLAALTDEQREAVRLDDQGYDNAEVAEMTGKTVGSIKSLLKRARQRLRKLGGQE